RFRQILKKPLLLQGLFFVCRFTQEFTPHGVELDSNSRIEGSIKSEFGIFAKSRCIHGVCITLKL
ncbi:MAG: hypothetical protein RSC68_15880, partial [Acinetobacter sp.]